VLETLWLGSSASAARNGALGRAEKIKGQLGLGTRFCLKAKLFERSRSCRTSERLGPEGRVTRPRKTDKEKELMKKVIAVAILIFAGGLASSLLAQSEASNNIFAQQLADEFTAKYMWLITVGVHAKPPNASDYQLVAHTVRKNVGGKSTAQDLDVMKTGTPDGPNSLGGGVYDVVVQLFDASGKTIGVVALHIKPGADGDPKAKTLKLAYKVRDELKKRIPTDAKLFESAK
jgi:hypothetical protein